MKPLLLSIIIVFSSFAGAQASVSKPLITLEPELYALLDHLGIKIWRFSVPVESGETLFVDLTYHERDEQGEFSPETETQLANGLGLPVEEPGPQDVSISMSEDAEGILATISLNGVGSFQTLTFVDFPIPNAAFSTDAGSVYEPHSDGMYVLRAAYKEIEIDGVTTTIASEGTENMVAYLSVRFRTE